MSGPSLETTRSILRAAGQEGKSLRDAVADVVMDEATEMLRRLRVLLGAANDRSLAYKTAWEQAEAHNKLLQDERSAIAAELARRCEDRVAERREHQRAHADLFSLLSIITLYPNTLGVGLADADVEQLWRIADRWTKEQG